ATHDQDLHAGHQPEARYLRGLRQRAHQLAYTLPVPERPVQIPGARPERGTRMEAGGLERLAAPLVVMGEQGGVLVESLGLALLDGTGDGRVDDPALLLELGAERHLLGQRVREGVLRDRIE